MSRNVKDWVRTMVPKLGDAERSAFEAYLSGNETFAEAAITLIETLAELVEADRADGEVVDEERDRATTRNQATLDRILDRVNNGEDAEAVVREEIQ